MCIDEHWSNRWLISRKPPVIRLDRIILLSLSTVLRYLQSNVLSTRNFFVEHENSLVLASPHPRLSFAASALLQVACPPVLSFRFLSGEEVEFTIPHREPAYKSERTSYHKQQPKPLFQRSAFELLPCALTPRFCSVLACVAVRSPIMPRDCSQSYM